MSTSPDFATPEADATPDRAALVRAHVRRILSGLAPPRGTEGRA